MLKTRTIIFCFLIFLLLPFFTFAQTFKGKLDLTDETQVHLVKMDDGTKYKGQIKSINDTKVIMELNPDREEISFDLGDVYSVTVIQPGLKPSGRYQVHTEGPTTLFASETAFLISKGKRQYRTVWGAMHTFDKAVSNNFTVGGGLAFPGLLMFKLKFAGRSGRKGRWAAGFNTAFFPVIVDGGGLGSVQFYTSWTRGKPDQFFNLSTNLYFISEDLNDLGTAVTTDGGLFTISLGGAVRITDHWSIITENAISTAADNIELNLVPSFGVSWFNEKNRVELAFKRPSVFTASLIPFLDNVIFSNMPFAAYSRYF